jgi:hypothetical protein
MIVKGKMVVGVWSDLDGPKIRSALLEFGLDVLPVLYLDGPETPVHYKLRRVPGEPVSLDVLSEMMRAIAEPWIARDQRQAIGANS